MIRTLIACSLAFASFSTLAQSASAPTSSPAKKELVAKIIKLQQPGVEAVGRLLVEQPLVQMMQGAGAALQQRVAADRREAVARDIQADLRKASEELVPQSRDKAIKIAPTVIAPMLEERFTEDELKQLIAILESPVNRKYQAMGGEMQKALSEKLVAEMRPTLEPKLKSLQQTIAGRLAPASASGTGK